MRPWKCVFNLIYCDISNNNELIQIVYSPSAYLVSTIIFSFIAISVYKMSKFLKNVLNTHKITEYEFWLKIKRKKIILILSSSWPEFVFCFTVK